MSRFLAGRGPWLAAFFAAAFFAYGLIVYLNAGGSPVQPHARASSPMVLPDAMRPLPNIGKYAGVAGGRIFFGEPVASNGGLPVPYFSSLALRGIVITQGRALAVLARKDSPPESETWTARVGDTVLGEKVAAIDKDFITLSRDGQETVLVLQ